MVIISHVTDGRSITLPPHLDIEIQQKRGIHLTRDMANRDKRKHKTKHKTSAVILAIAGIAVLAVLIWTGVYSEKREETTGSGENEKVEPESDVVWKGKGYNYNEHLSNFLFIGVDNREKVETETGRADAGQADALYLVSWDWAENTLELITIPRDTMTRIETFGPGGECLGESTDHISLSYAYGDGEHESCRLTRDAVSALFYDLPVQGYCAVNMDALPVITESAGGVTVTVPNDSLEEIDSRFQEGAQVTVTILNENGEPAREGEMKWIRMEPYGESQRAVCIRSRFYYKAIYRSGAIYGYKYESRTVWQYHEKHFSGENVTGMDGSRRRSTGRNVR